MTHTTIKLSLAGVVLISAIGYLAYAGMKDGWAQYHVKVDEFMADAKFRTQQVRMAGKVGETGLVLGTGRYGAQFNIIGETQQVPVAYKGMLPDLFKGGCDVVVEGKLDSQGVFQATTLLTKCASKYESGEHAKKKTE